MSGDQWVLFVSLMLNVALAGFLFVCWRASSVPFAGWDEEDDDRR